MNVSVIIPTFNSAETLPEAVECLCKQDWDTLETIIVDDGSSDNTASVVKDLSCANLRFIRQSNAGPGAARNRGIEEAGGDWIAFLDADDIWLPGKLKAQFEAIGQQGNADFCYTDAVMVSKNGNRVVRNCDVAGPILQVILRCNPIILSTVLVRRECFEQVGLFDDSLRTGEDWDMWLRLVSRFNVVHVPSPLLIYSVPDDPHKYPLELLEKCTLRVLEKFCFSQSNDAGRAEINMKEVYSLHYSILAKSYLRKKRFHDFIRLSANSLRAHPNGFRYLFRRGLDNISICNI